MVTVQWRGEPVANSHMEFKPQFHPYLFVSSGRWKLSYQGALLVKRISMSQRGS